MFMIRGFTVGVLIVPFNVIAWVADVEKLSQ